MKLVPEDSIRFQVDPELTAIEAIRRGGFKYRSQDAMFRNATHEMECVSWVTIATYKIEGADIERQLVEFKKECTELGYVPANLWHLCLLAHNYPQMHRRIIAAPGTVVDDEGIKWMPTIDGLNRHAPCISQIKTELLPTSMKNEEFVHTSYKELELLAVKVFF